MTLGVIDVLIACLFCGAFLLWSIGYAVAARGE
jgi:hypothetical protein